MRLREFLLQDADRRFAWKGKEVTAQEIADFYGAAIDAEIVVEVSFLQPDGGRRLVGAIIEGVAA